MNKKWSVYRRDDGRLNGVILWRKTLHPACKQGILMQDTILFVSTLRMMLTSLLKM